MRVAVPRPNIGLLCLFQWGPRQAYFACWGFQNCHQPLQRGRIELVRHFDPPAIRQLHPQPTAPLCSYRRTRRQARHQLDRQYPAGHPGAEDLSLGYPVGQTRLPFALLQRTKTSAIFIQRRYGEAMLQTKILPPQPTLLILQHQSLSLNPAPAPPPPSNPTRFAHAASPSQANRGEKV